MGERTSMMQAIRNGNGWMKYLLGLIPLLIGAAIAFGALNADVKSNRRDIERKADRELVTQQYNEIIRRLDQIDHRLP